MKKLKALLAACLALTLLVGCSSGGGDKEAKTTGNKYLQNANIRKALAYAVNTKELTDDVLKDGSVPARGFMPSKFAYGPDKKDYAETADNYMEYNLEKAQEFFDKGLEELGEKEITLRFLYEKTDPANTAADYIYGELSKIKGLNIQMEGVDQKNARTQKQSDRDFDITLTRWGPDYADPTTYLALMTNYDKAHFFNYGDYNNDKYDELVTQISEEKDLAKRWQLCKDAEAILFQDGEYPVVPLFQTGGAMLVKENVKGLEVHTFGTPYIYKNVKKTSGDKTLVIAKENGIESLDLLKASSGMDFEVINAYSEGLMALDKDGQAVPGLAESYKKSDDGLVYTFKIRQNAKWANGDPVTAHDFVYSWKRTLENGEEYQYFFTDDMASIKGGSDIYNAITNDKEYNIDDLGVKAIDDKTLEVTLSKPIPYFLSLTAFPTAFPMNEKFVKSVEDSGKVYGADADSVLACGPFKLTNYVQDNVFELAKNDTYWDAKNVNLDGITMKIIKTVSTAEQAFVANEVEIAKINSSLVDKYKDKPVYDSALEGYLWFLQFNIDSKGAEAAKAE